MTCENDSHQVEFEVEQRVDVKQVADEETEKGNA
jgi:hypothetical protein